MLGLIIFGVVSLAQGADLPVKVNKITSTKTQLPYEYYSLDYCLPEKIINSAENLGEVLRGDIIENSPYVVSFQDNCLRPVGIFY
jgi:transmembrane 9 superfamily protein 2/4